MRNLICLSIALFLFGSMNAQNCPIISFDNISGNPGDTVSVSMYLEDMPSLDGISGTVTYDPSVLSFVESIKGEVLNDGFSVQTNEINDNGQILLVGLQFSTQPQEDFIEPSEIAKFIFVIEGQLGSTSPISIDGSIVDLLLSSVPESGLPIGVAHCGIVDGSVTVSDVPSSQNCPIISFDNISGNLGDTISVSMYLEDMPSIAAIQGTITYDPNVLSFVEFENGEAVTDDFVFGTNEINDNGQLLITGSDLSGGTQEDFIEPSEIVRLFFVVEGQLGSVSPIGFDNSILDIQLITGIDLIDHCGIVEGSVTVDGTAPPSQNCPIVSFDNVSGNLGDTVSISMYLEDMPSLAAMQGTVTYDPSVLTFIKIENGESTDGDFELSATESNDDGQIRIVGTDFTAGVQQGFIVKSELARLFFVVEGQSDFVASIGFDDSAIEIVFISSPTVNEIVELDFCGTINGSVTVSETPPSVFEVSLETTNSLCNETELGSISATAANGTPPYTFAWGGVNGFSAMGASIDNLIPGLYNLTATDSAGDTVLINDILISDEGGDFEVEAELQQNFCDTGQEGFINTNVINNSGNPLAFEWSNGATTEDLFNLSNGTYTLTISDFGGCTETLVYEINSSRELQVDFETNMPCAEGTNGSINTTSTSDDLTFAWSNGSTMESIANLEVGVYTVTITEPGGCEQVREVELVAQNENSTLELSTICSSDGLNNGRVSVGFVGDLANTAVTISSFRNSAGEELSSLEDLANDVYSISVTSVNGCEYAGEAVVEESLSNFREAYFSCNLDSIQIETSTNNPNLQYSWSPAESFSMDSIANPIYLNNDTTGASVTLLLTTWSPQGCSRNFATAINNFDNCVWPGDTNEDQMVSAVDLLNIGLANGDEGPARLTPNVTEWFTQPAFLWQENIGVTNLDKMFADCNGDGVVDAEDVLVVEQNEGLTHLSFTSNEELNKNIGIPLFVDLAPNYVEGVEHDINIVLGDTDDPGVNVYGVAFQIEYDPEVSTITPESFREQGWMSADEGIVWDIDFMDDDMGLMDVAITRIDKLGIDGLGTIATFKSTFMGNDKSVIDFAIINAVAITNIGEEMVVDNLSTNSNIGTNSTNGINASLYNESIMPNPATDFVQIISDREILHYDIYNTLGQRVQSSNLDQNQIDVHNLIPGLYYIYFDGPDGATTHKLMVK